MSDQNQNPGKPWDPQEPYQQPVQGQPWTAQPPAEQAPYGQAGQPWDPNPGAVNPPVANLGASRLPTGRHPRRNPGRTNRNPASTGERSSSTANPGMPSSSTVRLPTNSTPTSTRTVRLFP